MDLVRHIIERAVVSVSYALPAVRLCMGIIEVRINVIIYEPCLKFVF